MTDFDENTAETYDGIGRLVHFGYFDGSHLSVTYGSTSSPYPTPFNPEPVFRCPLLTTRQELQP